MIAEREELVLKVEEVGTILPFRYSAPAWELGFVKHTHKEFQTHSEEGTRLPPDTADNINVNGRGPVCSYCRESGVRAGLKPPFLLSLKILFSVSGVLCRITWDTFALLHQSPSPLNNFFLNTVSMPVCWNTHRPTAEPPPSPQPWKSPFNISEQGRTRESTYQLKDLLKKTFIFIV